MNLREIFAGDVERGVNLRADAEEGGVVVPAEFADGDVFVDGDASEEADIVGGEVPSEVALDIFDALVVWRDSVSDEAEGEGPLFVDMDGGVRVLAEFFQGEECGGPASDEGDFGLGGHQF